LDAAQANGDTATLEQLRKKGPPVLSAKDQEVLSQGKDNWQADHRKRERARVAEVKAKKRAEERENNRLNNKANAEAKYKEDEEAGKITGGAPVQAFVADFDPKEATELELMRKTGYKRVSIREDAVEFVEKYWYRFSWWSAGDQKKYFIDNCPEPEKNPTVIFACSVSKINRSGAVADERVLYLTNKRLYLTKDGGIVDADKVIDIGDIELVSQPGRDTVACVKGAVAKRANKAARDWLLSFYDGDALAHFMYHLVCLRGSLDCVTITVEEHLPKWVTKQVRTGMTEDRTWFVEANGPDEDDNVEGIVAKSVCAEKCEKHPHSPWQAVFFTQPPTKPT